MAGLKQNGGGVGGNGVAGSLSGAAGTFIGDGVSTSFALTHTLNNTVFEIAIFAPGGIKIYPEVVATSATIVTVNFAAEDIPANLASYSYLITAIQGSVTVGLDSATLDGTFILE